MGGSAGDRLVLVALHTWYAPHIGLKVGNSRQAEAVRARLWEVAEGCWWEWKVVGCDGRQ